MYGSGSPGAGGYPQGPAPGPAGGPGGPASGPPFAPPYPPAYAPPGPPAGAAKGGRGIAIVLVLLLAVPLLAVLGGTGWYLTRPAGAFKALPGPCALLPLQDVQRFVPQSLPQGDFGVRKDGVVRQCMWRSTTGIGGGSATLTVGLRFYGRSLAKGADEAARQAIKEDAYGGYGPDPMAGPPRHKAGVQPGLGDEAYRIEKAFGGQFDSVVFRRGNVMVTVAYEYDRHRGGGEADRLVSYPKTLEVARLVLTTLNTRYGGNAAAEAPRGRAPGSPHVR
jgi:hypothetical protein